MPAKRPEKSTLDTSQAWHRVAAGEIDGSHFQLDVRGDGLVLRYGFVKDGGKWSFYEHDMEAVVNKAYRIHRRTLESNES